MTTSTSTGIPAPERGFRCSVDRYGSILPGVPGYAAECRLVRGIPVGAGPGRVLVGFLWGLARGLRRPTEPWHHTSHHGNEPEKLAALVKINTWQIELFGRFLGLGTLERTLTATSFAAFITMGANPLVAKA